MRAGIRWLVGAGVLVGLTVLPPAVAAAADELQVLSASPQGELAGGEQERIQIVFSAPVIPLGEAKSLNRPPQWLTIAPPLLARWRWAGTSTLIGEPLAPLPRATTYRLTVHAGLAGVDGRLLAGDHGFWFMTPRPMVTILAVEGEELEESEEHEWAGERQEGEGKPLAGGQMLALTWNQPVDAGSLSEHLKVHISPRPLAGAQELLTDTAVARLEREAPLELAAWRRFLVESQGAPAGEVACSLRPHPKHGPEVFLIEPAGCWPTGARLEVDIAAGVKSLEGDAVSAATEARFLTPYPFAPLRLGGRQARAGGAFDPEAAELVFSSPVAWRDLAEHVTYRASGEPTWRQVQPFPQEWTWSWETPELGLGPLGLAGGSDYELCLAPGAIDVLGRELAFPWCGRLRTARRTPQLYLVEGDGVVEWNGPHLLPLKALNVTSIRELHTRVSEEQLAGVMAARQRPEAKAIAAREIKPRPTGVTADRSTLLPLDLDRALTGRPGVVLSRIEAVAALEGSEYDADEAHYLRLPRTALTQVTSLGLSVKASQHEGLLVWVTSLATAQPAPGIAITVWDEAGKTLWRGASDARGLARTPAEINLANAFVVTARAGDDLAYARTLWWEGHRGWEFNLPVDYARDAPVIGHLWADRGVVRPGEKVHLKAVLRRQGDRELRRLTEREAVFVVRDSRGEDMAVRPAALDRWGAAEIELAVPATASLGGWEVLLGGAYDEGKRRFPEGADWGVSQDLRVAEFRRPKLRVRVAAPERLVAGDPFTATVAGELLAGGPMAAAPVRWVVRVTRASWRPPGSRWDGWELAPVAFASDDSEPAPDVVAQGEAVLDGAGRYAVQVPRVEAAKGFPVTLEAEAEVSDIDRQSSAARARAIVLPGEFALGVERPPFFVKASDRLQARVVALAPDGGMLPGVKVKVELQRRHWESVRRREVSGRYVFESRAVIDRVAAEEVVTGGEPASASFALAEGGEYALVATARDSRDNEVIASTELYVFGSGFTPWRMDRENRIELLPERTSYTAGETARVLVKSPWEKCTALITVERAGVLEARVEELSGTMPMVEIPLRAEYTPNVFVSVVLLRGRVAAAADPELVDPGKPAYRVGYCEITLPPTAARLAVKLVAAKAEYRPGQKAQATVKVAGADGRPRAAGVTLWAVDAGVLELTGYRTPDLLATFYARRGLGVTTAESRSRVVGRRSFGTKGDRRGGGGGVEAAGEQVRRDFRALAVWQGEVTTDARGEAAIEFTLPDSLTTYRLMAVATAGEQEFGASECELTVTKPLGLEPALPRFLRPEDRARAGVVVRNRTKAAQEVEVTLALAGAGPLQLRGGATRTVSVPAGGSAEVGFGLVALEPGTANLKFTAAAAGAGGERDAIEVPLAVLPITPAETVATFFSTADRATEMVQPPADVFPSAGGLDVTLASSVFAEAGGGLRWLLEYPHGCAEQISSRLLGIAAAARLGAGLAPEELNGRPLAAVIEEAVAALATCQRPDGGYGFWPGAAASNELLTAHALWALAEAAKAGAAVDARAQDLAAAYLSRALRRERWGIGEVDGWTAKVLASFVLARLGRAEPAYFQ
ncbi:MAG: alpha-2-macroglobulin family protein, partial [Acidobacteriota bacterium]